MRNKKNETITLKKGGKEVQLDYADLRKAVLVLRAVNHKLRQRVIDLLEENDKMTVTDIYIKLSGSCCDRKTRQIHILFIGSRQIEPNFEIG